MRNDWTLTVDLRQKGSHLVLEFALLSVERRYRWSASHELREEGFHLMARKISEVFDRKKPFAERAEKLKEFNVLAEGHFRLSDFLKSTHFSAGDTLTVSTLVTAIPWDLVPFGVDCLGQSVDLGIKIPTPHRGDPTKGLGSGGLCFVHVVANPRKDLSCALEEVDAVQAIVSRVPGLHYELVADPTPVELINRFSQLRNTSFFHFTGHVSPKNGLVLIEGSLSIEEIVRFFPRRKEQIVFLNGCDVVYGSVSDQDGEQANLFLPASVANAFLHAGVEAVIAPRSLIADNSGVIAAERIWTSVFSGAGLGAAVRTFRQQMARETPSTIEGYSYILYGDPSACVRPTAHVVGSAVETPDPATNYANSEILREAAGHAGGEVAPRLIFAALTRRWALAHIYFDLEGQQYIGTLEELRKEVGAVFSPVALAQGTIALTAAGRLVVEQAVKRRPNKDLDELGLLEGLLAAGDPEVQCALEKVDLGPRSMDAIVREARAWVAAGRPVPDAVVLPDGYFNQERFLPNLHWFYPDAPIALILISRWDLFGCLLRAGGELTRFWNTRGLQPPPVSIFTKSSRLHRELVTGSLRDALDQSIVLGQEDRMNYVDERCLVSCLAEQDSFAWSDLPMAAREWLLKQRIHSDAWQRILSEIRFSCLGWV